MVYGSPHAVKWRIIKPLLSLSVKWLNGLVDIDTEVSEVSLGEIDFGHELLVSIGDVVEGHDAEAETEEQQRAEGDEGPEGELLNNGEVSDSCLDW